MKDERLYLVHIVECIERIRRYTVDGRDAFLADERTQDAVLRNLQTLAESTRRLSPTLRAAHPAIDWRMIGRFRNVVVHDYLTIDVRRIWAIVERELGPLDQVVRTALDDLGPADEDSD